MLCEFQLDILSRLAYGVMTQWIRSTDFIYR